MDVEDDETADSDHLDVIKIPSNYLHKFVQFVAFDLKFLLKPVWFWLSDGQLDVLSPVDLIA